MPPEGFEPVKVVRCVDDAGRFQDDGTSIYTITESSAAPSPELLNALNLPDSGPLGWHEACPAAARAVLYLLLVNADDLAYRPRIPITPCHEPRAEVDQAINTMQWRWLGTFEVRRRS